MPLKMPLEDAYFYRNCLNLEAPGMDRVKKAAVREDYAAARHELAEDVRGWAAEHREAFLRVPFEVSENAISLPEETEDEVCRRVMEHRVIVVGIPYDFGKYRPIDWEFNPTDNQYKEWTWQLNRHREWKVLAHTYNRTGDESIARSLAEQFSSWVAQAVYPGDVPSEETRCWRTIECGLRMGSTWPYTLISFSGSPAFTDELIQAWLESVWQHGLRLRTRCSHANWLIMEMNGLAQIGVVYPQLKQAEEWYQFAMNRLDEELDRQLYPDGFQYELATGYHDVVLLNFERLDDTLKVFGRGLYPSMTRKLDRALELMLKIMMPDGTTPDLNDGRRMDVRQNFADRERMLPDARCVRWLLRGDEACAPDYGSTALEWSGYGVMRNGWGPDAVWAIFDDAPFGRGHQHEDKLNFLLYANGKLVVAEGGNYAYDGSEMRRYILSTRSHNTARVDGMDQNRLWRYQWNEEDIRKKAGLQYSISGDGDFFAGSYDEGYGEKGACRVKHSRRVFFLNKNGRSASSAFASPASASPAAGPSSRAPYFIIVDRLEPEDGRTHSYEVLWHVDDSLVSMKGRTADFSRLRILAAAGQVNVVCGQTAPELQGFIATGEDQGQYKAVPTLRNTISGAEVRMVTVLDPETDETGKIAGVEAGADPGSRKVRLTFADGTATEFTEPPLPEDRG